MSIDINAELAAILLDWIKARQKSNAVGEGLNGCMEDEGVTDKLHDLMESLADEMRVKCIADHKVIEDGPVVKAGTVGMAQYLPGEVLDPYKITWADGMEGRYAIIEIDEFCDIFVR